MQKIDVINQTESTFVMVTKTEYQALLKSRDIIIKNSLEEFQGMPYISFILKKEFHEEPTQRPPVLRKFVKWLPVKLDGSRDVIRVNDFEIIDIGDDFGDSRYIKISEKEGRIVHTYKSTARTYFFLFEGIVPLINNLEQFNSWEIFLIIEKSKQLEFENKRLQQTIETLRNKISELQSKET